MIALMVEIAEHLQEWIDRYGVGPFPFLDGDPCNINRARFAAKMKLARIFRDHGVWETPMGSPGWLPYYNEERS